MLVDILFKNHYMLIVKYIYMNNHEKCIVIGNFRGTCASVKMLKGYMRICWNAEGVHAHLSECWRGTW